MKKIFVFGSINMDLVMETERMPMTGESFKGRNFMTNQGGKGANQAVACKKLGGERVMFIGAVGKDAFGEELISSLGKYGVETEAVIRTDKAQSGVCMIILDKSKNDNVLLVDTGANEKITVGDFGNYLKDNAEAGDIFITQLEVSLKAVREGLKLAKEIGMFTVLNPAPAVKIGKEFLRYVDLLVLNETETALVSGTEITDRKSMEKVYDYFSALGVKEVIVTRGGKGGCYLDGTITEYPAFKVNAVDTTSAGDTFIGAIALKKAQGRKVKEALSFASRCSAVAVSRKGAAVSIPTADEVELFDNCFQRH